MKTTKQFLFLIAVLSATFMSKAQAETTPVDYFGATPDLHVSGANLVDAQGNKVVLHGVMETPSAFFNKGRWTNGVDWANYDDLTNIPVCLKYFKRTFQAVANPKRGTYCNLFRLHLDPCWLQDKDIKATGFTETDGVVRDPHGKTVAGEASIYHFSMEKFKARLTDLYIPIIEDALAHGLYVIVRPPGVFPEDVVVDDYYHQYLKDIWNVISSNEYIKAHAGQISLELGNEPLHLWTRGTTSFTNYSNYTTALYDFFQPIVTNIRNNGFTGIIWAPGTGYQAEYRGYTVKMLSDPRNNLGFAVHFYPGWYNTTSNDLACARTDAEVLNTFKTQIPVQKDYPIVITEVDWSPKDGTSGHYDEHGNWVVSNFGTWGTGSTSEKSRFGEQYKYVVDQCGNISWTIEGSDLYVDMDAYLIDGTIRPAFTKQMKAAGYSDTWQACSGSCFQWFKEYAAVNVPHGTPNQWEEVIPHGTTAKVEGSAAFDDTNGHYIFKAAWGSAFIFSEFRGTPLSKCHAFTLNLGEGTVGYRLDVQLKDKDGNIIKDGSNDYIIGTEAKGTRFSSFADAHTQTFDFTEIFADYITNYPGCTVGDIRINTAAPGSSEDAYWFTITTMEMDSREMTVRKGSKAVSLENIKLERHNSNISYVFNTDTETGTIFGGWGNGAITVEDGVGKNGSRGYKIVITEKKNPWEGQFNIEYKEGYTNGTEYTLSLDIKGTADGSIGAALQKSEGYEGRGNFPNIPVTTDWQTITVKATVNGEGANRILLNYGDYVGTLYIDNIKVYTGTETVTEITGKNIALNEEKTNGVEIFGAGLMGNVSATDYADLSDYQTMVITGTGGELRILYNRPAGGAAPETVVSLASGTATVDLSKYDFFHLNSIKVQWGNTATVRSIMLVKDGTTVDDADYYVTGAGYETEAFREIFADEAATVIDITGYTGDTKRFTSANPNCLILYKNGAKVEGVYDSNMVKDDKSAYMINLSDGYDFRSPFGISCYAGSTYSRDLGTTKWATMALPFNIVLTDNQGIEFYTLASVGGDVMTFTKATTDIPAGTVVLYRNVNGGVTNITGKNISKTAEGFNLQPVAGAEGWYTAQSFQRQVIDDVTTHPVLKDYEVYGISQGKFIEATKKLTLNPFRAFYLHKKNGSMAKSSFSIGIIDDVTGISESATTAMPTVKDSYNTAGMRVTQSSRGITIVRMSDGSVRKVMSK